MYGVFGIYGNYNPTFPVLRKYEDLLRNDTD